MLKIGSTGEDVKKLQTKLGLTPDGVFGPTTERKVKEWQRSNGLTDDGIVGQQTWDKLKLGTMIKEELKPTKSKFKIDKVKDDLKLKANWKDSDDLDMMFQGTYSSNYYRKLQRFVHKEYRKSQGFYYLKNFSFSMKKMKAIMKLGYYIPSAYLDKVALKKLILKSN